MESRSAFQKRASSRREPERRASGPNAVRPPMRSKARILAVDDSPDALTILRLFLSAEGFEVITAGGVTEALLRVQEQLPDLIITDYAMPGKTGLDLCRQLRSHPKTQHIPIVLHTGADLPPTETPPYDALYAKPASLAQLVRRVRSLLAASDGLHPSQH
jgi:two-component system phosphate regulon response regulator PhoB